MPAERSLREIGRVRATTTFCKAALEHAVSGIDIVLEDDSRLAEVEFHLRRIDLDSSDLAKYLNTGILNKRYVELRRAAVTGDGILKEFKADAARAPTNEQKVAMLSFADALDGALVRQKRLADAIGRVVAYFDSHNPIGAEEHDKMEFEAIESQNRADAPHPAEGAQALVPETLSEIAKNAATELAQRQAPIEADENDAAQKIEPAFAGC
jgi:hypothetical protein